MKKTLKAILAVLLCITSALIGRVWWANYTVNNAVLTNAEPVKINIESGTSFYRFIRELSEHHNLSRVDVKIWRRLNREKTHIKKGFYELPPNISFVDALQMVNQGKTKQFSITLIEGKTAQQWLSLLNSDANLIEDITLADAYDLLVSSDDVCANEYKNIEGCLLPNTYFYSYQDSVLSILQRAYRAMTDELDVIWGKRYPDIPLNSPYEALILGSIIEKETAIESERGEIAGVFTNRLNDNMRLQTDPTVIYGVGDAYKGDITRKHLNTYTPYNTYKIDGLPITPIAMPSKASLLAAVQPKITDAYYFVASGEGGHVFSETLSQHNKAVREYLRKQKEREN